MSAVAYRHRMALLVVGWLIFVALCGVQTHELPKKEPCIELLPDKSLPRDCSDVYNILGKRESDVYMVRPLSYAMPFKVYCEINRYEAWTVIMARFDGSENFTRTWSCYKNGFGDRSGEHWLGNDHIYLLTNHRNYRLRVDYKFWEEDIMYSADYSSFGIRSELYEYQVHIGGFRKCGYDGLSYHNGSKFSTYDKDNDIWGNHCSQTYRGGFWYGACHKANPTGLYQSACTGSQNNKCMEWERKSTKVMILKIAPTK